MHTFIDSPLGTLTAVGADGTVTGLFFAHDWRRPDPAGFGAQDAAPFARLRAELAEYFAGARTSFSDIRLPVGDEWQRRVWTLVAAIGYGRIRTYGEIAAELGQPGASREVGAAVGRNPLAVLVPCHRVVGRDGALVGYAGGLTRKRFLLDLEAATAGTDARLF
jgi:methylated-DNA-[protein]-cysteine S-methyltransferase